MNITDIEEAKKIANKLNEIEAMIKRLTEEDTEVTVQIHTAISRSHYHKLGSSNDILIKTVLDAHLQNQRKELIKQASLIGLEIQ